MPENNNENPQAPNFEGEEMKMPENTDAQPGIPEPSSSVISGPLLAILALFLILILGGMYYWFTTLTQTPTEPAPAPVVERPTAAENNEPESTTAESQIDTTLTTSPSDELDAISSDLDATNLDNLDGDLNAIDAEINADLQTQP